MNYFPFFMDIKDKKALVVGGGKVAQRKVEKLLPFEPAITVLSPHISEAIREIPGVTLIEDEFRSEYLEGCFFVIAATNDRATNRKISDICKERNIPVNSVDDKDACTFIFPAYVIEGNLTVGISTGGASPTASVYIKEKIANAIPEGFSEAVDILEKVRTEIKPCFPEDEIRAEFLRDLLDEILRKGKVYIVGAGCGDYDLITLRGLKALRACDVVVYDDLIDERLLDEIPRNAETIYVGKRKGKHSQSQEEINEILVNLALEGKIVVRLKGGDPFVFGRGGEEIIALKENGIAFEEIPGISSAIAIPAAEGIPVTHRGMSRDVHIITAHTAEDKGSLPGWYDELAAMPGTLVFLMGLTKLEQIASRLISAGKSPDTPAAVISGGNSKKKMSVRASLQNIAQAVKDAKLQSPAVIVIGEVAALELKSELNGGHIL